MPVTLAPYVATREVPKDAFACKADSMLRTPPVTNINSLSTSASTATSASTGSWELERSVTLPVKNTFINYPIDRPPSLEEFLQERQVRSWPVSLDDERDGIGLCGGEIASLFDNGANGVRGSLRDVSHSDDSSDSALAAGAVAVQGVAAHAPSEPGAKATFVKPAGGHIATTAGEPKIGSPEVPTAGSAAHHLRKCKPCAFALKGCKSGITCQFCHLCDPGEKKRRKKDRVVLRRNMSRLRQMYSGFLL